DTVSILLGQGNGRLGGPTDFAAGPAPVAVVVADLNGDGNGDLVIADRSDGTGAVSGGITILPGTANGTFGAAVRFDAHTSPVALTLADFNADGLLDVAAANLFSS